MDMESCDISRPLSEEPQARESIRSLWRRCPSWRKLRYILLAVGCVCLGSLILAVCLSHPSASVPSTHTLTSTVTTRTTTRNSHPLCPGSNVSDVSGAAACFCLYGGRCLQHFHCEESLAECQELHCGEQSLQRTDSVTSFLNIKYKSDVLSIPVERFRDIKKLKDNCPDHAQQLLTEMVTVGRHVFMEYVGGTPELQCVHLYPYISVPWLHLHTFVGAVPSEHLPSVPPRAACTSATVPESDAAAMILSMV